MAEPHWTPQMVVDRLEEAAMTLHRLPDSGPQNLRSAWPDVIHEYWEAYGRDQPKVRLGPPTPDAIDRMDECMEWLRWLEPNHLRLVWLRAERVRWKIIMRRFGRARSTLAAHWQAAIFQIVAVLNRGKKCPDTFVPDKRPGICDNLNHHRTRRERER
ncbi:DUF6362 family protein [Magnetofaba australis]|uniref:DUF6362 family protein n=1 Tax=Magnetofaba australis TaxID=1472297 RepID=UPI0018E9C6AC|nr:DUF6362 family protein [Magnetofaba australis]